MGKIRSKEKLECIRKFSKYIIPRLEEGEVKRWGFEKIWEVFTGMFENGTLNLTLKNNNDFTVWAFWDNEILLFYDEVKVVNGTFDNDEDDDGDDESWKEGGD